MIIFKKPKKQGMALAILSPIPSLNSAWDGTEAGYNGIPCFLGFSRGTIWHAITKSFLRKSICEYVTLSGKLTIWYVLWLLHHQRAHSLLITAVLLSFKSDLRTFPGVMGV